MPFQTANQIKIYYEQHGSGDDLILIGGLTSDHNVWKSVVRLLEPHFRVLIFDNRGAGETDAPDYPYTLEMMAQDTLQLMDALKIKRAHILGHSMGGGIAQQIAVSAPERIHKLILACTTAKFSARTNMIFNMRETLENLKMNKSFLAEYVMPFLFSESFLSNAVMVKGFIQWAEHNPHPQSAAGYRHQLHASSQRDFTNELKKINAETLVITGEEDIIAVSQQTYLLSQLIKNSVLEIIPECAHMPHIEKTREFSDILLRFF